MYEGFEVLLCCLAVPLLFGIGIWMLAKKAQKDRVKIEGDLSLAREQEAAYLAELDTFSELYCEFIREGEISINVEGVSLGKKETVYWVGQVSKLGVITKVDRVNYAGLTYRHRITKGLSWRMGSIKPVTSRSTVLEEEGVGRLLLTSSGIYYIPNGLDKSWRRTWRSVVGTEVYDEGLLIRLTSGRPVIFSVHVGLTPDLPPPLVGMNHIWGDPRLLQKIIQEINI